MFTAVKTTNFRKLRDFSTTFREGLTAIRALNEAGKSTLLEAIAYALFGTDALREPLADVVTWGEKDSTLKVELEFEVNKTKLRITRGKSGAEIFVDGKLSATGQKEVTRFVEQMFGAPPKVAGKLMLANQASLRGALADGPTATAQLIEQLSNFSLIDEVIQLVTEKLPCGSTAAVDQQISMLAAEVGQGRPVAPDLTELQAKLAAIEKDRALDLAGEAECLGLLPEAKAAANALRQRQKDLADARSAEAAQQTIIANATAALSRLKPQSDVTEEQVAEWRAALAGYADLRRAAAVNAQLKLLPVPENIWEGTAASFAAARAEAAREVQGLERQLADLRQERAVLESQRITETICGLCGKDLQDVPEVVSRNQKAADRLKSIALSLDAGKAQLESLKADMAAYDEIAAAEARQAKVLAAAGGLVAVEDSTVPATWAWIGPDLAQEDPTPALNAKIEAGSAELRRAAQHQGQQQAQESNLAAARTALAQAQAKIAEIEPKVSTDRSIGLEADLESKLRYHQERLRAQLAQTAAVNMEIRHTGGIYEVKLKAYEKAVETLEAAQKSLEEIQLNNLLLKKLRTARPKVADKLWATILSAVSYYFSGIRGMQSAVSKEDDGFKVDGKPAQGLSGSTLDALGLAIRIALTKTFLPNIDFMVLDEPGAACDDSRESNMLGVLASCGFSQVLLVTHSPMADVFADHVVTL